MCAIYCMVHLKHNDECGACIFRTLQNMEILKYKQPILKFVSEVENIFRNHQVDDFLKTIVQDSSMLENQDELLVFMEKYYRLIDQQMFIVSII